MTSSANTSIAAALRALADAVEQAAPTPATDELVEVRTMGMERRAVDRLIASGTLHVFKVGRRLYTKRSALLALADKLPAVKRRKPRARVLEDDDELEVDRRLRQLRAAGGKR